jgi:thiamine biosynthesis protein ThiS
MPGTHAKGIRIQLNGEDRTVAAGLSVAELLRELDIAQDKVAVELNRQIVRQPQWATMPVEDGAQLEIVQFVGGG